MSMLFILQPACTVNTAGQVEKKQHRQSEFGNTSDKELKYGMFDGDDVGISLVEMQYCLMEIQYLRHKTTFSLKQNHLTEFSFMILQRSSCFQTPHHSCFPFPDGMANYNNKYLAQNNVNKDKIHANKVK